jgi:hypothetical protein
METAPRRFLWFTNPLGRTFLASGEAVGQPLRDCVFDDGMTQRPIVLIHFVVALLLILGGERSSSLARETFPPIFFALSSRISRQYSITSFVAL